MSQYYNISFGISVILTIAALQQSVMYGGLSETTFSVRMASIMNGLEDTANGTCISVKNCLSLDFTDMATYIKNLPQETGAEVTFCVLQALAFVVFIPFTIAQYIGSNSDSGTVLGFLSLSVRLACAPLCLPLSASRRPRSLPFLFARVAVGMHECAG